MCCSDVERFTEIPSRCLPTLLSSRAAAFLTLYTLSIACALHQSYHYSSRGPPGSLSAPLIALAVIAIRLLPQ